jgi:hypothetical protein
MSMRNGFGSQGFLINFERLHTKNIGPDKSKDLLQTLVRLTPKGPMSIDGKFG